MPRQKRDEKLSPYHLDQIERQVALLRIVLTRAQVSLTPFRSHYDAISDLDSHLRTALDVFNDRSADYVEPHRTLMSGG